MNCLRKKKLAFMSIVNSVKGFLRAVSGGLPLILPDCADNKSIIDYSITGDGLGDYDEETGKYKIPVVCSGKNLIDMNDFVRQVQESISNTAYAPFTGVEDGRAYIAISPAGVSAEGRTYDMDCKPNARYTFSFYGMIKSSAANSLRVRYSDGTYSDISIVSTQWQRYAITSPVGKTIKSILLIYGTNAYVYLSDFQLEENQAATDYEPYVEPVTTNIYLNEPLAEGQTINYKNDNLPMLSTVEGTTIISVDTQVQPTNMEVTYYSTGKE